MNKEISAEKKDSSAGTGRSLIPVSLLLGFFLAEGIVRTLDPVPREYFIHEPNLHRIFRTHPEIMPGVEGLSEFIVNSLGLRGDEPSPDFGYRVLAWGGSTTECLYLDQKEAWPALLQEKLNSHRREPRVWVGNAGKTGVTTREHRFQIPLLLEQVPPLDAILLLVGVNDVLLRLARAESYDPYFAEKPESKEFLLSRGFGIVPATGESTTFWNKIRLVSLFEETLGKRWFRSSEPLRDALIEDEAGEVYITRRRFRKSAPAIRTTLPDLASGLEEYERNLQVVIDAVRKKNIRLVLLTQPVLWAPDLAEDLRDLLWTGGVYSIAGEGLDYYSVEVLAEAMDAYNDKLREIAERNDLELVDLAHLLPKDTTIFYDDCHFNENGARVVAGILTEYFLGKPSLGKTEPR